MVMAGDSALHSAFTLPWWPKLPGTHQKAVRDTPKNGKGTYQIAVIGKRLKKGRSSTPVLPASTFVLPLIMILILNSGLVQMYYYAPMRIHA